jgi:hypothetical protein
VINSSDLRYIPPSNKIQSVIIWLVDTNLSELISYVPHCRKIIIKKIKLEELCIPEGIRTLIIECIRMARKTGRNARKITITLPNNSLKSLAIQDISLFNLGVLPDSIESLYINSHKRISNSEAPKLPSKLQVLYTRNIDFRSIPDTVQELKLFYSFKSYMLLSLPENLKYLETDVYIKLPKYLEILKLRPEYDRRSIKALTRGKKHTMRILNIPPTLKQLEGYYDPYEMNLYDSLEYLNIYDYPHCEPLGREKLPSNLRALYAFITELTTIHSFPENLKEMALTYLGFFPSREKFDCGYFSPHRYPHQLPKLPQGLITLELNGFETIPELPESIQYLSLYDIGHIPELPKNLKRLDLSNIDSVPELPENLESLRIRKGILPKSLLPKNLKSLTINNPEESFYLHDSLGELISLRFLMLICKRLEFSPEFTFPDSIEELYISASESLPEYIRLPPRLKKLAIGKVKHGLTLPESITHLKIYYNCTEAITFPPCLKYLEISSDFDIVSKIQGGLEFPKTLEVLVLKIEGEKIIPNLPEGLRELHIADYSISEANINIEYPKGLEIFHHVISYRRPSTLPEYTEIVIDEDIKYIKSIIWKADSAILEF